MKRILSVLITIIVVVLIALFLYLVDSYTITIAKLIILAIIVGLGIKLLLMIYDFVKVVIVDSLMETIIVPIQSKFWKLKDNNNPKPDVLPATQSQQMFELEKRVTRQVNQDRFVAYSKEKGSVYSEKQIIEVIDQLTKWDGIGTLVGSYHTPTEMYILNSYLKFLHEGL